MATVFLIIIYLSFISLGLPDALLGSAWPIMSIELNASLDSAGIISIMITIQTIISSLFSHKLISRFGTGKVTAFSVLLTAGALLGISFSPSFIWLVLLAVPLGLGAGSVDAGLNNYVALYYKASHMNWLHCFWGIGATIGPLIMGRSLKFNNNWRGGYLTIGIIQSILVIVLFLAIPMWTRTEKSYKKEEDGKEPESNPNHNVPVLKIKGVTTAMLAFFFYCGTELSAGLWGASFLVHIKGLAPATAASWISLYYGGITMGRFISGFVTTKLSSKTMIRSGQIIALTGSVLLWLPFHPVFSLIGFILIGLGCAPIYPSMLHEIPKQFGKEDSSRIMGLQMASAYTGCLILPPILGFIASKLGIAILPVCLITFITSMLLSAERVNIMRKKEAANLLSHSQA